MGDADAQGKFVWPPRAPASEAELAAGVKGRATSGTEAAIESDRAARARAVDSSVSRERRGDTASLIELQPRHAWWRSIEEAWLGLVTPSFAVRAADAGWSPDSSSEYCGRCGHPVGLQAAATGGAGRMSCSNCIGTRPRYSRVVRLGAFDGLLRDAIHEVKFTAWRRLGAELGRLLGEQLAHALRAADVGVERVVLVPMPTTMRRRLIRGIDHPMVLARGVRAVLGAPIVHAVEREHRPSQTQVPHSQRRDNVARTMRLKRGVDLFGRLVVIIDDVMTTGSTMSECARAIREGSQGEKRSPMDVWAGVLSVAAEGARKRPAESPGAGPVASGAERVDGA